MKYIDAEMLKKAFLAGAKGLEAKKEWINELNVFPVPDGDTGTNMTMTIMSAAKEVAAIENPTMETLAKAISSGSLRGARGNSGVILSQLFRGFTREIAAADQVTTAVLANSFMRATETAYKAVMKPKEGTILTVAKGMAEKASELVTETDDVIEFCRIIIEHGDYVLSQTPEMLPVLKQAGVVDSGGQGLMQVMKGAVDCLMGKEIDLSVETVSRSETRLEINNTKLDDVDIKFGYCTEFIINLLKTYNHKTEQEFKDYLESIGDSIVVVSDDDMVKVHVHTNDPGLVIQKALTYGSLSRMKIDNMREEHQEKIIKESEKLAAQQKAEKGKTTPRKPFGFISVSVGEGLDEIFCGIGTDYLIQGGQTMNPSTEDMLKAINQVHADTIYILPNNKNIILAAQQAKSLVEDKKVVVIPSKTIPQGITAIINFAPNLSPEDNEKIMTEEMERVQTAQVTYAVRNTTIDDIEIREGDIMSLGDKGILSVGQDVENAVMESIEKMLHEESELVTVYYGGDVSQEDAQKLKEKAEEKFSDYEIELHSGGQPIYYYLISVE